MPALALAAMPGRRRATLELAREIERRGFSGIYCASFGDGLGLCEALALVTERIPLRHRDRRSSTRATSTTTRRPRRLVHELSGGRFRFGIGVSHGRCTRASACRPASRSPTCARFVAELRARAARRRAAADRARRRCAIRWSSSPARSPTASCSRTRRARTWRTRSSVLPAAKRDDPAFFVGNMIPTCISDDVAAAAAVNRKTLSGYVTLPNYREYWKEAGYVEEMEAIETALAAGDRDALPGL